MSEDVTLSHDSDGNRIADLEITVGVKDLDVSYQWLLARVIDSKPEPVSIETDEAGKVSLPPGLEGLLNFIEDIRERIDDAEIENDSRSEERTKQEALENHWDQREHYEEL